MEKDRISSADHSIDSAQPTNVTLTAEYTGQGGLPEEVREGFVRSVAALGEVAGLHGVAVGVEVSPQQTTPPDFPAGN